ncbi:ATP-grasp domain-containing protein [Methanothermobacter sp. KEPCO-1]|uniref:ATP-grasp domain-containing protein n=1 Tax=Methanothermobacter TaxID=145260 RepID=UPI0011C9A880|nr:ATP-grasp domain-containing protein [Methanothermobacter sp. KEPCO-1]QEF94983.1 ATP-grasp domain-containing protein [Methanothermobacter sp. KEPCO-1]
MKLLIFEYATASGIEDPEIFLEGRSMLEALLADFSNLEIDFLLSEKFADIEIQSNCRPTIITGSLRKWLRANLHRFDACIFIAAEEDMELYKLTELVEDSGVLLIGSGSEAVRICSDKRMTYRALRGVVPLIRTYERDDLEELPSRVLIKPADGVACQGIRILEPENLHEIPENMIIQEFVEGESVSVSLLSDGRRALPLSLNRQNILIRGDSLEYNGGVTPVDHRMRDEAFRVARRAVESIKGLRGYVGVDMILADKPYVVEINSRITTPYIGLRRISEGNLGHMVLQSVMGELPECVKFNGTAHFRKGSSGMVVDIRRGAEAGN